MLAALVLLAPLAFPSQDSLNDLRVDWRRAETPEERLALLARLSSLYQPDSSDAARVTEAVAEGLEDDSFQVRARAATLLADLDGATAVRKLARAAADFGRVVGRLEKELGKDFGGGARSRSGANSLSDLAEAMGAVKELSEAVRASEEYRVALIASLAKLRTDECVGAVRDVLHTRPLESGYEAIDALLGFGTADAVLALDESLERYADEREEALQALEDAEKERPGRVPRSFRGSKESWEEREAGRIEQRVQAARRRIAELEAWGSGLSSRLAAFAGRHGLPAPPEDLTDGRGAADWFRRARAALPTSLES